MHVWMCVQAACMMYDIDIICIPVTEKLPFFFKRAPVNGVSSSLLLTAGQ